MQPSIKSPCFLASLAALLASVLPSQQPSPDAIAKAMRGCALTNVKAAVDGALIGAGPDFEVLFEPDGVEFLPMLGTAAARNMPLRVRLESIRRGDTVVLLGTDVPPVRDGLTVAYARGGVVERYEVREEGVEQSFVFAARPAGTGDLRVRLQVTTELPDVTDVDGAIAFRQAGVGGVRVGDVTGVDALGLRIAGTRTVADGVLELTLPASFVDAASYPMVLDPLLSTDFQIAFGTSNDDGEPDVAYDATNDVYLVVWKRGASIAGTALRGQLLAANGALVGSLILISGGGVSGLTMFPRVANSNQRDRFLVVWADSASIFGPFSLVCCSIGAVTGALSATVTIAATVDQNSRHNCSGDSTLTDDDILVVWRTDTFEIVATQVTLPAIGDPVPLLPTVITNFALTFAPCISKSGGAAGIHVIAWQQLELSTTQLEIRARAVTRNLGLIGSELIVTSNLVNDTLPAVDGDGAAFALVWTQAPGNIRGRMLAATPTSLAATGTEFVIEADVADNETNADIAYLGGQKWCVVWNELGNDFAADVFGAILEANGARCGVEMAFPGVDRTPQHQRETLPRVVGKFAGSASIVSDEGLVVFGEAQHLPPFEGDVIGQRIEAIGQGGPVTQLSPSCSLGGTAGVSGPCALGNAQFGFTLTGADPSAPLALLALNLGTALFPCGTCTLLPALILETHVPVGGAAVRTLPIPCDPANLGFVLQAQWLPAFGASTPCPILTFLTGSNIVQVQVGF